MQIPYAVVTGCKNYNAYKSIAKITSATLLIGAQKDIIIDADDLQKLAKSISAGKSVIISDSGHNFEKKQNQTDLYDVMNTFIKNDKL